MRLALSRRLSLHLVLGSAPAMRERIEALRNLGALATLFVVLWHSRAVGLSVGSHDAALPAPRWLETLDAMLHAPGLAIHVPLFFLTSGFLFFRHGVPALEDYRRKLNDRARTLAVPYVLWNIGLLLAVTLLKAEPHLGHLMGRYEGVQGWGDALSRVTVSPIVYQFWFVRELILLSLLSPLFGLALRSRAAWPTLGLLATAFALGPGMADILSARAAFFFALGAFLALRDLPLGMRLPKPALRIAAVAYAASVFLLPSDVSWLVALESFAGVGLALAAYDPNWSLWRTPTLRAVRKHAFFVFAFHEPLLMTCRKAVMLVGGTGAPILALDLFLAPALTVAVAVWVAKGLSRRAPRLYAVLTGGRVPLPVTHAVVQLSVVASEARETERVLIAA